jgi:hypothetical protein
MFQKLHTSLTKRNVEKNTKIRILYSTPEGKRNIKECIFDGLLPNLWNLYDTEEMIAIAIFIIKDKTAQPIFKYVINNQKNLIRPKNIGHDTILKWKSKSKQTQKILTKMLEMKIYEELIYEFHIT